MTENFIDETCWRREYVFEKNFLKIVNVVEISQLIETCNEFFFLFDNEKFYTDFSVSELKNITFASYYYELKFQLINNHHEETDQIRVCC